MNKEIYVSGIYALDNKTDSFTRPCVYCTMRSPILLLLLINLSCMKPIHQYIYADGSANRYIITPTTLEYDPVKPEESSTGMYSGGDPKTIAISAAQFDSIRSVLDKGISNKAAHMQDRIKTSGLITVQKGDTRTQVVLTPNCEEKKAIEDLLKKTLSK